MEQHKNACAVYNLFATMTATTTTITTPAATVNIITISTTTVFVHRGCGISKKSR